jgi:hypothetical protein
MLTSGAPRGHRQAPINVFSWNTRALHRADRETGRRRGRPATTRVQLRRLRAHTAPVGHSPTVYHWRVAAPLRSDRSAQLSNRAAQRSCNGRSHGAVSTSMVVAVLSFHGYFDLPEGSHREVQRLLAMFATPVRVPQLFARLPQQASRGLEATFRLRRRLTQPDPRQDHRQQTSSNKPHPVVSIHVLSKAS